ncbi:hypothetical protein Q2T40_12545 [Winogradskyella maritima]|uniref:Uncharacterized protein n=1 Tax=Winogradskyella maritima TaxID=1517766 RepID=A0ABV8AKV1_9FLAO|nr:hypothetical protein [Winogradskyella maritima]
MVLNNIDELIAKYNDAETSLQEEQQLRDYFNSDDVAPHLEQYRPLFKYFAMTQKETFTKDVPVIPNTKKTNRRSMYQWIAVAAVTVLMLGFLVPKALGPSPEEVKEQELAMAYYNQTKEALSLISIGMNAGKEQLNPLGTLPGHLNDGVEKAQGFNQLSKKIDNILNQTQTLKN